jgi:hypothetical protein
LFQGETGEQVMFSQVQVKGENALGQKENKKAWMIFDLNLTSLPAELTSVLSCLDKSSSFPEHKADMLLDELFS